MKEKLQEDIKNAMRARDQQLLLTLRGLAAAIKQVEIDSREDVSDEKFTGIVQKEIKKRRDALEFAVKGGRDDLITQNKWEIEVLQRYLGEQLSEENLRQLIAALVAGGADNVGKIMGALNKEHKGKFDGRQASDIAKELLG